MQKTILILAFIFSISATAQDVQLNWQKDINLATEIAKSENKPVLIYFTKNDCGDCQNFYNNFFKQDAFKNMADDFVLLMLDSSKQDRNTNDLAVMKQQRLAMHYNKSSNFPAVLVINKDKMEIGELLTTTDQESIQNYLTFLESIK